MIELLVLNSSDVVGANGSATQRCPPTMNAYSCRPLGSGTDAAHVPFDPVGVSETGCAPHALKSPTSDTLFAWPTNTKRTTLTVSCVTRATVVDGAGLGERVAARVLTLTIAASDAAKARPASGET